MTDIVQKKEKEQNKNHISTSADDPIVSWPRGEAYDFYKIIKNENTPDGQIPKIEIPIKKKKSQKNISSPSKCSTIKMNKS